MNEQDIKEFQKNFTKFLNIENKDKILSIHELAQEYHYALTNGNLISKYIYINNDEIAHDFISILAKNVIHYFPDLYIFKIDLRDILENNKTDLIEKFKQFLIYAHILYISNIELLRNNEELYSIISNIIYSLHKTSHLIVSSEIKFNELDLDDQLKSVLLQSRQIIVKEIKEEKNETLKFNNFADFIKEVKKEAGVEEGINGGMEREEFIEKLYIWEMKNFNVEHLKRIINDNDINKIKQEFEIFTENVKKLIELHKEYGLLNTHYFKDDEREIESLLFDPNSIKTIEQKLNILKDKIKYFQDFRNNVKIDMYYENFISDSTNHSAYNKISSIMNYENTDNIIILTGGHGTGKTHLLNAILNNMQDKRIILIDKSNIKLANENEYILKYIDILDMILIDDLDDLFCEYKDICKKIIYHNVPKIITMHRKYSIEDKQLLEYINNYPSLNIQPSSLFIRKTVIKNLLYRYEISINEIMLNYLIDYISLPLSQVEEYIKKLKELTQDGLPDINQIHAVFPKREKKKTVLKKSQFDTSKMIKDWFNDHDRLYVEFED